MNVETRDPISSSEKMNIDIQVTDIDKKHSVLSIKICNHEDTDITFFPYYFEIETLKDKTWILYQENSTMDSLALEIQANGSYEQKVKTRPLVSGTYRIVKIWNNINYYSNVFSIN